MKSPFRSIRQKLFNEGKLVRYLGYAMGEIALIIIGIMVALELNNWNEDQKAQTEFDEYVVQLRLDVRTAIQNTEITISDAEGRASQGAAIFPLLKYSVVQVEQRVRLENGLFSLGKFPRLQVHVGLVGELLNGDRSIITRNNELARKAMDLERSVEHRMGILSNLYEKINLASIELLEFKGESIPEFELEISYDFNKIRSSEKFLHTVQSIVLWTSTVAKASEEIKRPLEEFLAVLEEY